MKFQIGDKVRLKEESKQEIWYKPLQDIKDLNTDGVFIISEIIDMKDKTQYRAKEFKNTKWRWYEDQLKLVERYKKKINIPIKNRWELLDL